MECQRNSHVLFTSELSRRHVLRTCADATYHLELHRPPIPYHGNCSGDDDMPNASKPCFLDWKIGQITTSSGIYFYVVLPCYYTIVVVQQAAFLDSGISISYVSEGLEVI